MLCALRGSRGRSGLVALTLSALLAVTLSATVHDGADDPLCGSDRGGHGHPAVSARDHLAAPHAEHCVFCHAPQSGRTEPAATHEAPPTDVRLLAVVGAAPMAAITDSTAQPARAPPA